MFVGCLPGSVDQSGAWLDGRYMHRRYHRPIVATSSSWCDGSVTTGTRFCASSVTANLRVAPTGECVAWPDPLLINSLKLRTQRVSRELAASSAIASTTFAMIGRIAEIIDLADTNLWR